MKKILIIGSAGMAGHTIYEYLYRTNKYDLYDTRQEWNGNDKTYSINVRTSPELLQYRIEEIKPDIIINCVGILVKESEEHPTRAIWLNSYFPHWLEKITEDTSAKIIHLSTDCVFSGKRGMYKDSDVPDGVGFYSKSKQLGEVVNKKDLTIRMSIIGDELKKNGSGLFSWFLRQEGRVNGYANVYWNGLTTLELAKAIDKLIDSDITGLYQLAPTYQISKCDLLLLLRRIWKAEKITSIYPDFSVTQDKTLVNSDRPIPNYKMPFSYSQMLQEYKDWIYANRLN